MKVLGSAARQVSPEQQTHSERRANHSCGLIHRSHPLVGRPTCCRVRAGNSGCRGSRAFWRRWRCAHSLRHPGFVWSILNSFNQPERVSALECPMTSLTMLDCANYVTTNSRRRVKRRAMRLVSDIWSRHSGSRTEPQGPRTVR